MDSRENIGTTERYYIESIEQDPDNALVLYEYRAFLRQCYPYRKADIKRLLDDIITFATQNIKKGEHLLESYYAMINIHEYKGNFEEAQKFYKLANNISSLYHPIFITQYFILAARDKRTVNFDAPEFLRSTLKICEEALISNPHDHDLMYIQAFCYRQLDDKVKANELYTNAIKAHPHSNLMKTSYANMMLNNKEKLDKAFELLKFEDTIDYEVATHISSLILLAKANADSKQYNSALDIYNYLIGKAEFSAPLHFLRADISKHLKKYPDAIKDYEIGIRLDSKNAMAHSELGWALLQVNKLQEAETELKLALNLAGDRASSDILTLDRITFCASHYLTNKNSKKCLELLNFVLNIKPDHLHCHQIRVALSTTKKQQYLEDGLKYFPNEMSFQIAKFSLSTYEEGIKMLPAIEFELSKYTHNRTLYAQELFLMAKKLHANKRYEDAISLIKKARSYYNIIQINTFLGSIYEELGKVDDAIDAYCSAVNLNHYNLDAPKKLVEYTATLTDENKKQEVYKFLSNLTFLNTTIISNEQVLEQIFRYIPSSTALQEVAISNIEEYMVSLLSQNKSIKSILLFGNVDFQLLAQVILHNSSITNVRVQATKISYSLKFELAVMANNNILSCFDNIMPLSTELKPGLHIRCEAYRNVIQSVLENQEVTDHQKVAQLLSNSWIFKAAYSQIPQQQLGEIINNFKSALSKTLDAPYTKNLGVLFALICNRNKHEFMLPLDIVKKIANEISVEDKHRFIHG